MSLAISLRSEILKTKRTASFYLTLIAAAVIPIIFILDMTVDGISPENKHNIFSKMFEEGFKMTGFVVFPMFVILISTLLPQIEFKNNAWKQVFASPQTKVSVFAAKFINIHLLIIVFLVINQLLVFLAAVILHLMEPTWHVLSQPINGYNIFTDVLNSYVTVLALGTFQFWLGLRFKNFIVPIAIGISCWVVGCILVLEYHSSYAAYFPYSFHVYNLFPKYKPQLNAIEWTSGAYALLFIVLGFIDFNTRRKKG
jgi:lantibiotic transport system permease protein